MNCAFWQHKLKMILPSKVIEVIKGQNLDPSSVKTLLYSIFISQGWQLCH